MRRSAGTTAMKTLRLRVIFEEKEYLRGGCDMGREKYNEKETRQDEQSLNGCFKSSIETTHLKYR